MDISSWVSNPAETRGPLLVSVFWTLLVLSTIAIALRIWARYKYSRLRMDDWCLIFAYVRCAVPGSVAHKRSAQ